MMLRQIRIYYPPLENSISFWKLKKIHHLCEIINRRPVRSEKFSGWHQMVIREIKDKQVNNQSNPEVF